MFKKMLQKQNTKESYKNDDKHVYIDQDLCYNIFLQEVCAPWLVFVILSYYYFLITIV